MAALGYTQLDRSKRAVRLLTVAPGGPDDQIQCELTHADLDERPSFIALSYTWDQGGGQDEIQCCGHVVQVSKNLCNFLHRFRVWDEGRGSRLWIDALCINQHDVHERNHQVGQMRALYSTATSTIAWLGDMDGNSDLVYSAILLSAPRQSLGLSKNETRKALTDLLNRPYWSRVWVIQEFLLPMDLHVWWGRCRVKASDLRQTVWAMAELSSRSKPRYPLIWDTPGSVLLRYRTNYQTMCRFDKHDSCKAFAESMTLPSLLRSFSASQCTLKHDSVYALLGIASNVIHSSNPISPDYTKSPTELLLDVLRNQYGGEIPEATHAWNFIESLCNVLGLNRLEIQQSAFVRARKAKRESRALDIRNLSIMSFDWWSPLHQTVRGDYITRRAAKWIILAMGRETGCLGALQDYLEYSRSHKESVEGQVKSLLKKNKALFGKAHIRSWADMSDLTMVTPGCEKEKLHDVDPPSEFTIDRMYKQLHDEKWSMFSRTNMMGFMRTAISGSGDKWDVVVPQEGHKPQVASHRWFGKYGAAIVLECRCQRNQGHTSDVPCYSPDWHVVGTAFVYQSELREAKF